MTEQLGIIREVGYGCRDVGRPVLWFSVYIGDSTGALQVKGGSDADQLIEESGVYDVHSLDGWPCTVEVEAGNMKFIRLLKGPIAERGRKA